MRCGTHKVKLYRLDRGQADKSVNLRDIEGKSIFVSRWFPGRSEIGWMVWVVAHGSVIRGFIMDEVFNAPHPLL